MKLKKALCILFALLLCFGPASGCGKEKEQDAESDNAQEWAAAVPYSAEPAMSVSETEPVYEAGTAPAETTEAPTEDPMKGLTALAVVPGYVNVRSGPATTYDIVGKIYDQCAAVILEETEGEDGTWYRITSGNLDGYIKSEFFIVGEEAEAKLDEVGVLTGTVNEDWLRVRSAPDLTDPENVYTFYERGTLVYIRDLTEDGWAVIESDDAGEGYVYADCLKIERVFKTAITLEEEAAEIAKREAAEEAARIAQEEYEAALAAQAAAEAEAAAQAAAWAAQQQAWQEQQAAQAAAWAQQQAAQQQAAQQLAAQQAQAAADAAQAAAIAAADGTQNSLRNAVVAFALQFVGNPYVHGGRSLVYGTDCSGFTSLVYQNFGYYLDYTPAGQAAQLVEVPLDQILPGDLLFYSNTQKWLGHVAMYIGNGQIVHAGTPETGIFIASAYYRQPLFARRVIN